MFFFVGAIEFDEMADSVDFMVEVFRIGEDEGVLRGVDDTQANEIVVPETVVGAHEEAFNFIGQEQLNLFVVGVRVALRCLEVFVFLAPFETLLRELVAR